MADIHIHRAHTLGLPRARSIAKHWVDEVSNKLSVQCVCVAGPAGDRIEFTRSGVGGHVVVAADHFELHAKLGFLLGPFAQRIQAEVEKNLDQLLAAEKLQAPPLKVAKKPSR